jgi:hypothetical protein
MNETRVDGATRRRRVVINGIGTITPIGITQKGMWEGITKPYRG